MREKSVPFYVGLYSSDFEISLPEDKAEQLKNSGTLSMTLSYHERWKGDSGTLYSFNKASVYIAEITLQTKKSTDFIWTHYAWSFNYAAMEMVPQKYCLKNMETKEQLLCGTFE